MSNESWGIGNRATEKAFGTVKIGDQDYELIFGEHPHSRSDNNIYARHGSEIIGFDGYRIQTKVEIEETNYHKESYLSGDEIRKGGSCRIFFDNIQCYEFFHRNAEEALLTARNIIRKLKDSPSDWSVKDRRDKLVGRKVYYRDEPAVIESLLVDQGCLILIPDGIPTFKKPAWRESGDDEYHRITKVEVTDESIWWFRD